MSREEAKNLFKKGFEHIHTFQMPHFGDVLTQESQQGIEQVRTSCTVQHELVKGIETRVEEFAEPSLGFLVQVIWMDDIVHGEDAFDEVETASLHVLACIDAESELADQAAGEDEVKVGPSRFTLFEDFQTAHEILPKLGIGFFFTYRVRDDFGHVETLCRFVGMTQGEHVGRLNDSCFPDLPYLLRRMSLEHQVEHRHGSHHRAQLIGSFPF